MSMAGWNKGLARARGLSSLALCISMGQPVYATSPPEFNPSKLPPATARAVDFKRDIQPLFEASCWKCHGPEKAKNGLRLDSSERALAGGDNGKDIVPGDSSKSPLVYYVARLIPDMEMPPSGK